MNTDILIINGSPRKNRNCFKISEEISNKLNQNNISNKIFNIFKENNIDFKQVFTSELSMSFIVDNKYRQRFIELLGVEFDL